MDAISKHLVGVLREGNKVIVGDAREGTVLIDGRLLKPDDRIHGLVDIVDDHNGLGARQEREIIVIDGRVYERVVSPEDKVYELVDVVEKGSVEAYHDPNLNDEMLKRITEVAERIAREMVPGIVERVIREEIDKLKR